MFLLFIHIEIKRKTIIHVVSLNHDKWYFKDWLMYFPNKQSKITLPAVSFFLSFFFFFFNLDNPLAWCTSPELFYKICNCHQRGDGKLTAWCPNCSYDINCSILSNIESMVSTVPRTGKRIGLTLLLIIIYIFVAIQIAVVCSIHICK